MNRFISGGFSNPTKTSLNMPMSATNFAGILILITAVLYSAPSRKSTQERSQPNPWSNNVVLRLERKRAEWVTGVRRSATGSPFQAVGPATEKALRCRITVRIQGTSNSARAEERNEIRR